MEAFGFRDLVPAVTVVMVEATVVSLSVRVRSHSKPFSPVSETCLGNVSLAFSGKNQSDRRLGSGTEAMVLRLSVGVKEGRRSEDSREGKVRELQVEGESLSHDDSIGDCCSSVSAFSDPSLVTGVRRIGSTGRGESTSCTCSVDTLVSNVSILSFHNAVTSSTGYIETDRIGRGVSVTFTWTGFTTEKCGIKELGIRTGWRRSMGTSILPRERRLSPDPTGLRDTEKPDAVDTHRR